MLTRVAQAQISEPLLRKLLAVCRPTDFSDKSTLFHMGREQMKREVIRVLSHELNQNVEETELEDLRKGIDSLDSAIDKAVGRRT